MTTKRLLTPTDYRRTPWKNGGGTTITIAEEEGVWQFGRTPITQAGPFSDYTGFDRLQVLVAGSGLVLQTPEGDIDVRTPFKPVRFRGDAPIVSRLEAGPVEVVNLIGRRSSVALELRVLGEGEVFAWKGTRHPIAPDHTLRIDDGQRTILALMHRRVIVAVIQGA